MDKNSFSGDLRRQFFNMAFLTYGAFDFAADARGYTWGLLGELYHDDWAFRAAFTVPPVNPNDLPLDFHFWQFFGTQAEIEHVHTLRGQPGAVRLLGFANHENMGRFDDAVAAFRADPSHKNGAGCTLPNDVSSNSGAPGLCWVRKPNTKIGIGLNLEQAVGDGFGLFLRGMYSDGQTEVYSFTSTDMSLSFGALARGEVWRRPRDLAGVGVGMGWISKAHAEYLRLGGIDGFVGDGTIRAAPESVVEAFYSASLLSSVWLSADYQLIANPAFNADRGPVNIFGVRLHAEF
jgi:carbohydrate-selective porin OprB